MEFKVGVYEDIPFEDYNEIPAYRASDLKDAAKCMYTWKNRKGFVSSPALLEGSVQHNVFLEFHNFDKDFVIQPPIDRRTKVGKAEYEDFLATAGNRTVITQDHSNLVWIGMTARGYGILKPVGTLHQEDLGKR